MNDLCFYLVVLSSLLAVSNTVSKCSAHYYFDTCNKLYVLRIDNILLGRCVGISAHYYSIEQQGGMEMNDISCNLESEELVEKTYLFW
jgi:hypothetical protein